MNSGTLLCDDVEMEYPRRGGRGPSEGCLPLASNARSLPPEADRTSLMTTTVAQNGGSSHPDNNEDIPTMQEGSEKEAPKVVLESPHGSTATHTNASNPAHNPTHPTQTKTRIKTASTEPQSKERTCGDTPDNHKLQDLPPTTTTAPEAATDTTTNDDDPGNAGSTTGLNMTAHSTESAFTTQSTQDGTEFDILSMVRHRHRGSYATDEYADKVARKIQQHNLEISINGPGYHYSNSNQQQTQLRQDDNMQPTPQQQTAATQHVTDHHDQVGGSAANDANVTHMEQQEQEIRKLPPTPAAAAVVATQPQEQEDSKPAAQDPQVVLVERALQAAQEHELRKSAQQRLQQEDPQALTRAMQAQDDELRKSAGRQQAAARAFPTVLNASEDEITRAIAMKDMICISDRENGDVQDDDAMDIAKGKVEKLDAAVSANGTTTEDDVIIPSPTTALRRDAPQRIQLAPGAYSVPGPGVLRAQSSSTDYSSYTIPGPGVLQTNASAAELSMARLRESTEAAQRQSSVMQAAVEWTDETTTSDHHNHVDSNSQQQRKIKRKLQKKRQIQIFGGVGVLLVLLLIIVIAVAVSRGGGSTKIVTFAPTLPPTNAPTAYPTLPLEDYILTLLPHDMVTAISQDATSPQHKAHQWLLRDTTFLPQLTPRRIRQRLALATLFFAAEGAYWNVKDGWLQHWVHECLWWSSPNSFHGPAFAVPFNNTCERDPATFHDDMLADGTIHHIWLNDNALVGNFGEMLLSSQLPVLLPDLKSVALEKNQITGSLALESSSSTASMSLGQFSQLTALTLSRNQLSGSLPSDGESWPSKLVVLQIQSNPSLTGELPTALGALTELRYLLLDKTGIAGMIPTEFGLLSRLQYLYLKKTELVGTIPTEIGRLTNLLHLDLESSGLGGTIPTQLGLVTSLEWPSLQRNLFTGRIPTELGRCTDIYAMEFHNNTLTGAIPSEIGLLTKLRLLDVEHNNLSGTVPLEVGCLAEFAQKGSLTHVYLNGNPNLSGRLPNEICFTDSLKFDCLGDGLCGCGCECPLSLP